MTPRDHFREGEAAAQRYTLAPPRGGPINRAGATLGARAGSSLEFRDHRSYEPGDDLRFIDWGAYARSDLLTVKLYQEEIAPHLDVLIDGSASMALVESEKPRAALALAGFLTAAATNGGYSHAGWWLSADALPLGDRTRRPEAWEAVQFEHRASPVPALTRAAGRWRPRGMRVFISDLLWDADPRHVVRQLADRAAGVVVVQVLAANDANPPANGHLRLIDSETDQVRDVRVDAAMVRRYRDNLARLQSDWHSACQAAGATFAVLIAEDYVQDWRVEALIAAGVLVVG